MHETQEYEDIYGHRFTLTDIPSEERILKERRLSKTCPKKLELRRLIKTRYTQKPLDYNPLEIIHNDFKTKNGKKYVQPGLVVQVDNRTTMPELQRLLHLGARTLFFRLGYAPPDELNQIMVLVHAAIDQFHIGKQYISPIGIAVELSGHGLRTGRVRNDKPIDIEINDLTVLTCNTKYQYVSQRQIIYVWNLHKYVSLIRLRDIIFMNKTKIQLRVVKILNRNITCCVEKGKSIRSYMDVEMPYYVANYFEQTPEDIRELQFAIANRVQFLVLPAVSSVEYIKQFAAFLEAYPCECNFFVGINTCIATNECIAKSIIESCDGIWLDKLFKRDGSKFSVDSSTKLIVRLANELQLPIVGKIPIKTRPDFTKLEKNELLPYLDSILIEKSPKALKFPIIARKLFCVQTNDKEKLNCPNFFTGIKKPSIDQIIPEPISFHLNMQKCSAVIINSTVSQNTAKLLSRKHVTCPIIVVVANERIAKQLNLYRNLKVVLCDERCPDLEDKRIEFGTDFGLWSNLLREGDFIISFYDSMRYECVVSNYRALYVAQKEMEVDKYNRTDYVCHCVCDVISGKCPSEGSLDGMHSH